MPKQSSPAPAFTFEDDRFSYGERRFVTLGLLKGIPVSVAHTETAEQIRVISFRKATDNEAQILFAQIQDQLPPLEGDKKPRRIADRRTPRGRPKAHRRRNRKARPKGRSPKASISLRVDADVLEWFRSGGSGYQSRINAVLRAFKEAAR